MTPESITYKPSGIDWLGDIPSHWEVRRLKYWVEINARTLPEATEPDYELQYIDIGNVDSEGNILTIQKHKFKDAPSRARRIVKKGDVIVSTVRTYLKAIAYVDSEDENLIASTGFAVLSAKENVLDVFLQFVVRSNYFVDLVCAHSDGVSYPAITSTALGDLPVAFPPLDEQVVLTSFLEKKIEEIEAFLSQKQRFIDLLREQKQAIINEAVTKGIYPQHTDNHLATQGDYQYAEDAPWLDGVPRHWEIRRLKDIVLGKLKYGANESGEQINPAFPRYIRITDFDFDGNLKHNTFRSLPHEVAEQYLLSEGDILFARSGATVGKTFQFKNYKGAACFAGYLIKATPNPEIILSDFLYHYTNSNAFDNWKNSIFSKATIENIGADKYSVLPTPVPPLAEQIEIVAYIEREVGRVDQLANQAKREMALMQEYRSALVTETVTRGLLMAKRVREKRPQVGI